ncbi:hypothetical protein K450DRAFT_224846 [Umbelopsis ramanniana AG]|uniref:Peptidase S26 domain-containing protein n=1 Tax=Umbelopsis ramanniana AG TaxID=1314678 RepID=A0AAD5EGW7_UMBRA|nr:uncharacterized protein K450DRAFT_224846 [Umbelopsis ramanniana AG]KAI8582800.1 hypothetical protein K450DRAFT_224846 [Umbelopsis ramanniana AG]
MNALRKAGYVVQAACLIHLFHQNVGELTYCMGPSMLPTFNMDGDIVAIEHLSKRYKRLSVGDVVVCISPVNPGRAVCKRILGMEGDHVCEDPTLREIERKYIDVPEGHVWLSGDNLSNSNDSRTYGPVPYGLIRGRVFARVWPDPGWIANNFLPYTSYP